VQNQPIAAPTANAEPAHGVFVGFAKSAVQFVFVEQQFVLIK